LSVIYQPLAKISPITEHISIGGLNAYGQLDELAKHQFVLNVAWEVTDSMTDEPAPLVNGSLVHNARLDDNYDPESQHEEILRAVALVNKARSKGDRVLVTCAAGRNRSGLVIAEHLIQSGREPDDVIWLIQNARHRALTNTAFVAWLLRPRHK
jgi:protein-tyrosine phosphatase